MLLEAVERRKAGARECASVRAASAAALPFAGRGGSVWQRCLCVWAVWAVWSVWLAVVRVERVRAGNDELARRERFDELVRQLERIQRRAGQRIAHPERSTSDCTRENGARGDVWAVIEGN